MKGKNFLIYVLEDDKLYNTVLLHFLSLNPEHEVKAFSTGAELMRALHERPDFITLDYSLPDGNAGQLMKQIKETLPDARIVIISAQQDVKIAIDLLKKGADDYIVKDGETQDRLWVAVKNCKEKISLKKEIETLQNEVNRKYNFQKAIIGNSPAMKPVFSLIEKAAITNITISVTGETGTGKDLVAKAIHYNSIRRTKPFVPVNIAAIPAELMESELFGHEKGAFTGASAQRLGKFEEAHKGTLFLDEIGEMDINLQAKLLRVLQEKEITRIGSNKIVPIDVRIIVATHRNLLAEVKKGNFREDLYYRLLGLTIQLPPLRNRDNDILLIAKYFIDQFCSENALPKKFLSMEAKKQLLSYQFPGNIRELKSVIELSCVMSDGDEIELAHSQRMGGTANTSSITSLEEPVTLRRFTLQLLQDYLEKYEYDVLKVAQVLNVGKSTLYRLIKNKELNVPEKVY